MERFTFDRVSKAGVRSSVADATMFTNSNHTLDRFSCSHLGRDFVDFLYPVEELFLRDLALLGEAMAFCMPHASIPYSPAAKAAKKFEAGKKALYSNMLYFLKQDARKKFPKKFTESGDKTSARWETLSKPQNFSSAEALADHLTCENIEILNRPGCGFSELAGALINFNKVTEEMAMEEVLHPKFLDNWTRTWQQLKLQDACEVLNFIDFPTVSRSSDQLKTAVTNVLKFGNHVREHWGTFASLIGMFSTGYVDMSWILALGALTSPGAFANKIRDVPVNADSEKQALLASPSLGKRLLTFLVAEVHAWHGVRSAATSSTSLTTPATFVPLTFDSEEEEKEQRPDHLQSLRVLKQELLEMQFPTDESIKKKRKWATAFDAKTKAFLDKVNVTATAEAKALADESFLDHVKKLKKASKTIK